MGGIFSNDSLFGRIMTRIWILFWANLLFVLLTVPVVSAGAGFAALHFTMLKMLRGDGQISPFRIFWEGLKLNWRQGTIVWLVSLALLALLGLEYYWCGQFGGIFISFRYLLLAIGGIVCILFLYLYPVLAAFRGTLPQLLKDSIFFALKKPLYLVVILFFSIFPLMLTYTDNKMQPLYGFLWVTCGFSLICLLTDTLLLEEFKPYLPKVNEYGEFIEEDDDDVDCHG